MDKKKIYRSWSLIFWFSLYLMSHWHICALWIRTASRPWVKTPGWEVRTATHVSISTFYKWYQKKLNNCRSGSTHDFCPDRPLHHRSGCIALHGATTYPRCEAGWSFRARGRDELTPDSRQEQQPRCLPVWTGSEAEWAGHQQLRPVRQHTGGSKSLYLHCWMVWIGFRTLNKK